VEGAEEQGEMTASRPMTTTGVDRVAGDPAVGGNGASVVGPPAASNGANLGATAAGGTGVDPLAGGTGVDPSAGGTSVDPLTAEPRIADPGTGRGPGWLDSFLDTRLPSLVKLRRQVHAHPELSDAEMRTTALIRETLQAAGIPVTVLPGGTGLVAEIGAGDRVIGLRADIDALPLSEDTDLPFRSTTEGVAHACGHDVHLTVLLGAALALHAAPELPGRVRLLFQPAEEVMPGGAHQLVGAGAVDGLRRLFALHCDPRLEAGRIGLRVGPITSTCDLIEIEVGGPGGHTSRPQLTVDLVGALSTLAGQLPALLARRLDPRSGAVLVWGAIRAGEAPNAIPQRGTLKGTLRIMDRAAWDTAEPLVRDLVQQILAPTGASHRLRYVRGVPPVVNDPEAVAVLRRGVTAALGPDAIAHAEQSTGAEDFAVLLDHVPGALARLGVWDGSHAQVDLHSPGFRADERAIPAGVRTLVHTALAALAD
jgi:amidohydrolase